MPRLQALAPHPEPVAPVLARLLWQWLALGLFAIAGLAMFRGQVPGTPAFWLLAAPATALLTLYRQVMATAWRARLVRATPRRRRFITRSPALSRRRNRVLPRQAIRSLGSLALRSLLP